MGESYQIRDQSGLYYFTFQVVGWADIFTRQCYRDIVLDSFTYCRKKKGLELFAYVIMTNHIHTIMRSKNEKLSDLVRDFKKYNSKRILKEVATNNKESRKDWLEMIFKYYAKFNKRAGEKQLWTHENHAIVLYSNAFIIEKLDYIHTNPVKAGIVEYPEQYLYSSARNYAGLPGILDIIELSRTISTY